MSPAHDSTFRSTTVKIPCRLGIHARCAARIVTFSRGFQSDIRLCYRSVVADAKSILEVMSLGAVWKSEVEIEVRGPDAGRAAVALETFFAEGAYCVDHETERCREDEKKSPSGREM